MSSELSPSSSRAPNSISVRLVPHDHSKPVFCSIAPNSCAESLPSLSVSAAVNTSPATVCSSCTRLLKWASSISSAWLLDPSSDTLDSSAAILAVYWPPSSAITWARTSVPSVAG